MPTPAASLVNITSSSFEGWEVLVEALKRIENGEKIFNMAIGDPDFDTPGQIVEDCKTALDEGLHHYSRIEGTTDLRAALADMSSEATGVPILPEQILVTPGGQASLFAALTATLDTGDHAILNGPYYTTYPGTLRATSNNFTLVENRARNGFQPDAAEIAKAIQPNTKAILINTPNNPTGVMYTKENLQAIADLCIENDLWLISDEVYWSLTFGAHVSPMSLEGMAERTIVVNSLSKSHAMTGWRVGWVTARSDLIEQMFKLSIVTTYGISPFISKAAARGVEHRTGMAEIAQTFRRRRALLTGPLEKLGQIAIVPSPGGMYVMIDIRDIEPDDMKFGMALLEQKNIAVTPARAFGKATEGHIRMSLCCADDDMPQIAEAICDFINTYPKA